LKINKKNSVVRKPTVQLFERVGMAYVTYHIKKFEESCCGEVLQIKLNPERK